MDKILYDFSCLSDVIEITPSAIIIVNSAGNIVLANRLAATLFNYDHAYLLGKQLEFLMPTRVAHHHTVLRKKYDKNPKQRLMGIGIEVVGLTKEGQEVPLEVSLNHINTEKGSLTIAMIVDITKRKENEQLILMMSSALSAMDNAVIGVDLQGKIIIWNKGAEDLYGYLNTEAIGQSIDMIVPKDKHIEIENIFVKLARGEHISEYETLRMHKNKTIIPVCVNISPVSNAQGKLVGGVGVMRNITKQKENEAKLKYLANHDELTGLINRGILKDRIEQGIFLAKRHQYSMAVCFLDMDYFKHINDNYGHILGDSLLVMAATRLREYIRESDSLARMGGDEFILILLELKCEDDAIKIIKTILCGFSEPFEINNIKITITLSIGIAFYPKDGEQFLLEKADSALYYVKGNGRNHYKIFDKSCSFIDPHTF